MVADSVSRGRHGCARHRRPGGHGPGAVPGGRHARRTGRVLRARRPGVSSGGPTAVDGRRVRYGVVGTGRPALFLHGWGLRPNAYGRAIEAMAAAGCRVVAPCLPGFGGTHELHPEERTFPGTGPGSAGSATPSGWTTWPWWPGHSMGGGVSTAFVHHRPGRVRSLLLANAIGGPTWALFPNEVRTMVQRPFWDWGRHFGKDLLQSPRDLRMLPDPARGLHPQPGPQPARDGPDRRVHPQGGPRGRGGRASPPGGSR